MTKTLSIALAGALLCGQAGAARAADPMVMDHGAAMPMAAPPAAGAADKAFAASNDAMMKGMGVTPSGDPDRDFVAMMLPHHRGAVAMAKVELRYGRDPELRKLAAAIVKAQAVEIARMQAWQKKNVK